MNKFNLTHFRNAVKNEVSENAPEILIGVGIFGFGTAMILSAKATPKAIRLIEAKKEELGQEELTVVETVKTAGPVYIPAFMTGVVSAACIVGANSIHAKRNAALATAYQLSVAALSDYKDTVLETVGEKKTKAVEEKYVAKQIEEHPPVVKDERFITNTDSILFYEPISHITFYSTRAAVKEAFADLNSHIALHGYASLNDLYDYLNQESTDLGEKLGWNLYREGKVAVDIEDLEWTKDGRPCAVIRCDTAPQYYYYRIGD